MEAQREIPRGRSEEDQERSTSGTLPPPPSAFPTSEFSRISAQLLAATPASRTSQTSSSSPSEIGARNPFGDSNAVSRNSIASTTTTSNSGSQLPLIRDPFAHEADGDADVRDDTSSLMVPPPEYEEFVGEGRRIVGADERRVSDGGPLPSYAAVEGGSEKREVGSEEVLESPTTTSYPPEKTERNDEKPSDESQQGSQPIMPTMRQRSRAELSAISDAISRVYATSPQLDNQRYTPASSRPTSRPSSRPTSRSGLGKDESGVEKTTFGGKLSGLLGRSSEGKGKRRESKSLAEEDEVVIEGRRMSRTMAEDLFQIWDNIDRAHGHRLNDQSQEQDPGWEAAKLEERKEAFYQELISKSGHGRLASQEHSGIPRLDQMRTSDSVQDNGESSLGGPVNRRYSFQPLRTPTSASAIDEAVEQSRLDSPGIVNLNHESNQSETERTRRPEPEAKTSEDEMVTLQDFIKGTEQELVTVQDFFKNELGRSK